MEDNKKLQGYLRISAFSLILVSLCYSCRFHNIADYSFLNKLDKDVELLLYHYEGSSDDKLKTSYLVPAGEHIKFTTLETFERSAPQRGDFCQMLDSVILRVAGKEDIIAFWRNGQEAEYALNYEMKWNFFCEWWEVITHGGSHAEYRYWLELAED